MLMTSLVVLVSTRANGSRPRPAGHRGGVFFWAVGAGPGRRAAEAERRQRRHRSGG